MHYPYPMNVNKVFFITKLYLFFIHTPSLTPSIYIYIYISSVTIKIVRIFENNENNNIKNILFNSGKLGKFVYTL